MWRFLCMALSSMHAINTRPQKNLPVHQNPCTKMKLLAGIVSNMGFFSLFGKEDAELEKGKREGNDQGKDKEKKEDK